MFPVLHCTEGSSETLDSYNFALLPCITKCFTNVIYLQFTCSSVRVIMLVLLFTLSLVGVANGQSTVRNNYQGACNNGYNALILSKLDSIITLFNDGHNVQTNSEFKGSIALYNSKGFFLFNIFITLILKYGYKFSSLKSDLCLGSLRAGSDVLMFPVHIF